jgi:hypothetical protein
MYFPRNWEFGSALSKLQNFGGGGLKPQTPLRYATGCHPVAVVQYTFTHKRYIEIRNVYVRQNITDLCILFIMLTMSCFGRCRPSSGQQNCITKRSSTGYKTWLWRKFILSNEILLFIGLSIRNYILFVVVSIINRIQK